MWSCQNIWLGRSLPRQYHCRWRLKLMFSLYCQMPVNQQRRLRYSCVIAATTLQAAQVKRIGVRWTVRRQSTANNNVGRHNIFVYIYIILLCVCVCSPCLCMRVRNIKTRCVPSSYSAVRVHCTITISQSGSDILYYVHVEASGKDPGNGWKTQSKMYYHAKDSVNYTITPPVLLIARIVV